MRVSVPEHVYAEPVEDETVLLELKSGQYYGLDTVGSRLWALLAELGSTEAAAEAASKEYDVSLGQLTRDLEALVTSLVQRNLLTLDSESSRSD